MKAVSIVIGSVLCAAVGFAAGAITASMRDWLQPIVHVVIENDSGEDLMNMHLIHESGGTLSTATLPALKHGQSTDLKFYVAGAGSYQIEAKFKSGRMVTGGLGYVEAGHSSKEVIGKSSIIGTHRIHAL